MPQRGPPSQEEVTIELVTSPGLGPTVEPEYSLAWILRELQSLCCEVGDVQWWLDDLEEGTLRYATGRVVAWASNAGTDAREAGVIMSEEEGAARTLRVARAFRTSPQASGSTAPRFHEPRRHADVTTEDVRRSQWWGTDMDRAIKDQASGDE